jgi:hypothetical protein
MSRYQALCTDRGGSVARSYDWWRIGLFERSAKADRMQPRLRVHKVSGRVTGYAKTATDNDLRALEPGLQAHTSDQHIESLTSARRSASVLNKMSLMRT